MDRLFDDPYASLFGAAGTHVAEATQRFLDLPFFRDGVRLVRDSSTDAVREGLAAGLLKWSDFHADDFENDLTSALEAKGFRRGAGAVFVWEGGIGYIDDAAIDRTLRFVANAGGARTRLVFTFGEGSFDPETATDRVRRMGFSSCEEIAGDELWRRYLPGEPSPVAWVMKMGTAIV